MKTFQPTKEKPTKEGERTTLDSCLCTKWETGDGKKCYAKAWKLTFENKTCLTWSVKCQSLERTTAQAMRTVNKALTK